MNALTPSPAADLQASTVPFNILENAIELGRWEITLCPPDKMYGPALTFLNTDDGQWEATQRKPWTEGSEVTWRCTGNNPHMVMAIFREHLTSQLRAM